MSGRHRLLERQLARLGVASATPELQALFDVISEAYAQIARCSSARWR